MSTGSKGGVRSENKRFWGVSTAEEVRSACLLVGTELTVCSADSGANFSKLPTSRSSDVEMVLLSAEILVVVAINCFTASFAIV